MEKWLSTPHPITRGCILSTDTCDSKIQVFIYKDFDLAKNEPDEKQNRVIMEFICKRELKAEDVENYKREHPLIPADIYKSMAQNSHLYPDLMKFFKLSLLIPPSTTNVESGFSVLTIKYHNSLTLSSLDKMMQLIFLGTPTLSDET